MKSSNIMEKSRSVRAPPAGWNRLSTLFVPSRLTWTSLHSRRRPLSTRSDMGNVGSHDIDGSTESPRVRTSLGWVEGLVVPIDAARDAHVFLGVPFAKPPVGPLRFKRGYAVMVYIHGGGYVMDCAAKYHYRKCVKHLVRHNVIVVTLQYRLGVLGYFCLDDNHAKGNYGLWDQVAALKFIKENIAKFGGDPNRITVFGQSAGGASTDLLSVSPVSRDLFQRRICMAGSAENNWAVNDKDKAVEHCRQRAVELGFKPLNDWDEQDVLACLAFMRKQPARKFGLTMIGERAVLEEMRLLLAPVHDDELLPRPVHVLRQESPPKETLTGVCKHEGLLFVLLSRHSANRKLLDKFEANEVRVLGAYNELVAPEDRVSLEQFKQMYDVNDDMKKDKRRVQETCIQMMDEFVNNIPTYNLCQRSLQKNEKCYFYIFEHYNPGLFHGFNLFMPFIGATHCTELAYVFDVNILLKPWKRSADDLRVRYLVTTMWTNFAKYGDPNSVRLGFEWTPVTKEHPTRHLAIRPKPQMEETFDGADRIRQLSTLFQAYVEESQCRGKCKV